MEGIGSDDFEQSHSNHDNEADSDAGEWQARPAAGEPLSMTRQMSVAPECTSKTPNRLEEERPLPPVLRLVHPTEQQLPPPPPLQLIPRDECPGTSPRMNVVNMFPGCEQPVRPLPSAQSPGQLIQSAVMLDSSDAFHQRRLSQDVSYLPKNTYAVSTSLRHHAYPATFRSNELHGNESDYKEHTTAARSPQLISPCTLSPALTQKRYCNSVRVSDYLGPVPGQAVFYPPSQTNRPRCTDFQTSPASI